MADNLSAIASRINQDIDPNGAPESITALNHNEILQQMLRASGKYTGLPFAIRTNFQGVVADGDFFFSGAFNTNNTAMVSGKTVDGTAIEEVLGQFFIGGIIHLKDFIGRSVFFSVSSITEAVDDNGAQMFILELTPFVSNTNYAYQTSEVQIGIIELLQNSKDLYDRLESVEFVLGWKADQSALNTEISERESADIDLQSQIDVLGISKINVSEKGQVNGVATLNVNGKVPLSQMNDALLGNVHWKGFYDGVVMAGCTDPALNGLPLPTASSDNQGWYFICLASFTLSSINYSLGDWIISNGTDWGKVDNTDAVSSVFGRVGTITAQNGDYNTSQVAESTDKRYLSDAEKAKVQAPIQITITTAVNITNATTDVSGNTQDGKNVIIDNGASAINYTINGALTTSLMKKGAGTITFVQGAGRTLVQVDGTAIFNGAVGSTATITSVGTTDYLRISNA